MLAVSGGYHISIIDFFKSYSESKKIKIIFAEFKKLINKLYFFGLLFRIDQRKNQFD